jgi:hypothetical protein
MTAAVEHMPSIGSEFLGGQRHGHPGRQETHLIDLESLDLTRDQLGYLRETSVLPSDERYFNWTDKEVTEYGRAMVRALDSYKSKAAPPTTTPQSILMTDEKRSATTAKAAPPTTTPKSILMTDEKRAVRRGMKKKVDWNEKSFTNDNNGYYPDDTHLQTRLRMDWRSFNSRAKRRDGTKKNDEDLKTRIDMVRSWDYVPTCTDMTLEEHFPLLYKHGTDIENLRDVDEDTLNEWKKQDDQRMAEKLRPIWELEKHEGIGLKGPVTTTGSKAEAIKRGYFPERPDEVSEFDPAWSIQVSELIKRGDRVILGTEAKLLEYLGVKTREELPVEALSAQTKDHEKRREERLAKRRKNDEVRARNTAATTIPTVADDKLYSEAYASAAEDEDEWLRARESSDEEMRQRAWNAYKQKLWSKKFLVASEVAKLYDALEEHPGSMKPDIYDKEDKDFKNRWYGQLTMMEREGHIWVKPKTMDGASFKLVHSTKSNSSKNTSIPPQTTTVTSSMPASEEGESEDEEDEDEEDEDEEDEDEEDEDEDEDGDDVSGESESGDDDEDEEDKTDSANSAAPKYLRRWLNSRKQL